MEFSQSKKKLSTLKEILILYLNSLDFDPSNDILSQQLSAMSH